MFRLFSRESWVKYKVRIVMFFLVIDTLKKKRTKLYSDYHHVNYLVNELTIKEDLKLGDLRKLIFCLPEL